MAHLVLAVVIIVIIIVSEKTYHLPSHICFELKVAEIYL